MKTVLGPSTDISPGWRFEIAVVCTGARSRGPKVLMHCFGAAGLAEKCDPISLRSLLADTFGDFGLLRPVVVN